MYFRHEIEVMRVKFVSLQVIMPNKDHCSVPLYSNNRSKGQLGITFHRFRVDKCTMKSWNVRIRRDVGKNFQVSDCLNSYDFNISNFSGLLELCVEPCSYFTTFFMCSLFSVIIKHYKCPLDFEKHKGLLGLSKDLR